MKEWLNWSGSLRFTPQQILTPSNEDEVSAIIHKGFSVGQKIRLVGAGHSSSPLVQTSDLLVDLHRLQGVVKVNQHDQTATLRAGMTVHQAAMALQDVGLALFNTGDVDVQTLAGAISTGTHGSGRKLQNLSTMLTAVRMINYKGDAILFSDENDLDTMKAMRVSLGSLGVLTELTVKVLPLFKLKRVEVFTSTEACMKHFDQLADENRNVDFYWYPRRDEVKLRVLHEPGKGSALFPFPHNCETDEEGWVGEILPRKRELKFDEMEYAMPRESGMACFQEVRKRIKERHRKEVAWRVLFRTIASDVNYLSPHYKRDSVSISLHHNAGLPFEKFFSDIEPIFVSHGGRPHWAKKHNLTANDVHTLYPEWNNFHEVRRSLDPEQYFLNDYLTELFDVK